MIGRAGGDTPRSRAPHAEASSGTGDASGGPDVATSRVDSILALLRAHPEIVAQAVRSVDMPDFIGRYEIIRELGSGGFGRVFLAYDPLADRAVALKIPRPDRSHPGSREDVLREARAAAQLASHENVVPVWDVGEHGDLVYIVSEFCEGGPLDAWLRRRSAPVSPRLAARIAAELADGVQHAHDGGVLHRDLKPGNVLLRPVGPGPDGLEFEPRVSDFGLARHGDDDAVGDQAHGTRGYMAPEQTGGRGVEVGRATDVYGLGSILFTLLTGRPPFEAEDRSAVVDRILRGPAPPVRVWRPDVPRDLEAVVSRCLEKDPVDRYPQAADLADHLRKFLAGEPIPRSPWWKQLRAWVRRRPWRAAGLAALGLALTVGYPAYLAERRWAADRALAELETVPIASFPRVLPRLDPRDPHVARRLGELLQHDDPRVKLGAALALAPSRPDAREYAYRRALDGPPEDLRALAPLLQERVPKLLNRLEAEVDSRPTEGEADDIRRANAALALITLGRDEPGYRLFRFGPDPQVRTFLIHRLGRAAIALRSIFERLRREPDVTIRRALILALGEVPDAAWDPALRREVTEWLLGRYKKDPDPGLHGAVKWLLGRWGESEAMRLADPTLGADESRRWRVGPLGMTFVQFESRETGRLIEIADTEITVGQIAAAQRLGFRKVHFLEEESPGPEYPLNGATYNLAAEFLNWLSLHDKIPAGELAYRLSSLDPDVPLVPVVDQLDRAGYRLLVDREFEAACRAGTTTARYHGESVSLLSEYAWHGPPLVIRSNPVARLKPNDFGLFDMLGNVGEVCQSSAHPRDPATQGAACGGSILQEAASIRSDYRRAPIRVDYSAGSNEFGFRVARTVRPGK